MKKSALIIALLLSVCAFAQIDKYIPERPNPPRLVNDFAKLLTPEQVQYLERKLVAYDDSTSNQIAIVTVENLHDYAAVDYATALGRKWGVGGREFNNGVIILISTGGGEGQRDAFIAPGYGLEGAIPDITANT
ncbi:MAG TPA: TPM domain-containing protein, partial [Flavisolibacter sp.]|nr:TPM domain-containing protein [Flavisolibacter sp.]